MISLDCSDMDRLGGVYRPEFHSRLPLINIDHHVTNDGFGDIALVDPSAAATALGIISADRSGVRSHHQTPSGEVSVSDAATRVAS